MGVFFIERSSCYTNPILWRISKASYGVGGLLVCHPSWDLLHSKRQMLFIRNKRRQYSMFVIILDCFVTSGGVVRYGHRSIFAYTTNTGCINKQTHHIQKQNNQSVYNVRSLSEYTGA